MSTVAQSNTVAAGAIAPGVLDRTETATPIRRDAAKALTTRFLDFWLIGGASLLVWLVMISVEGFRASWAIDQHFRNLTVTTASLSLLVNYPHFLVSYKLAYSRGRAFVTRNWWQLIVVPLLMIGAFAASYAFFELPVGQVPLLSGLAETLGGWGQNARVLSGPRFGDVVFTAAFNLMIFTVGWHYTKQVFGCMMVYSHFDGYRLSPAQRTLTKWALLSIWGMNFVYANLGASQNSFSQFTYYSFDLPDIAAPISQLVVGGGFALVVYRVFWSNYRASGQTPSLNLLAPFVALYVCLQLKYQERGVTNKRVVLKKGIIGRKTEEMKLKSIETVEIEQGVFGRLLGFGTVKITGRGVSDFLFKGVDDPMAVKRTIESISQPID